MNTEDADESTSCSYIYKGATFEYNQVSILYAPLLAGEFIEAPEKRFVN